MEKARQHSAVMAAHRAYSGALVLALSLAAGAAAQDSTLAVPSGQPLELYESFVPEEGAGLLYVSFLAPGLRELGITHDTADIDMETLCHDVGLTTASEADETITEIVIRLMAEPIDYGETAPGVTQYAAAYDVSTGVCEYM